MKIIRFALSWLAVFAVVFFGAKIAPSKIMMESWQDAAILSVIVCILDALANLGIGALVVSVRTFSRNDTLFALVIILSLLLLLCLNPIVLYFGTKLFKGVVIIGFWTFVIMGLVVGLLCSGISSGNKNND